MIFFQITWESAEKSLGKMINIKFLTFSPIFPSSEVDFDMYCFYKQFVGDGVCDDPNNNPYCFFDGGDCCLADSDTSFCKDCFCYLEENDTIDAGCAIVEWILFRAIGRTLAHKYEDQSYEIKSPP